MFTFDVGKFVPKFILADKNGYAIARAIQAAIDFTNAAVKTGVDLIANYETMPEWRLDELAWETNCLYDYGADLETKRQWIINAIPLYRLYGTPAAVYNYIGSYFDDIELEENWQYNGQPFHFRVMVDGEWTPENEAWARKAINTARNVRSVLDSLSIGSKCFIGITAECEVLGRFTYPMTGTQNWAGRWPQENISAVIDGSMEAGLDLQADDNHFPYVMAGTVPDTNTLGVMDEGRAGLQGDADGHIFPYTMAGTVPQDNTLGAFDRTEIHAAQTEDTYATIPYKMCGLDEI